MWKGKIRSPLHKDLSLSLNSPSAIQALWQDTDGSILASDLINALMRTARKHLLAAQR
jgi:hypothetical protein